MKIFLISLILLCSIEENKCESFSSYIESMNEQKIIKEFTQIYTTCPEQALRIPCFLPLKDFKNTIISSGYGVRKHPIKGVLKHHNGIDIASPKKDVIATATGIIKATGYNNGLGHFVVIDHQNSYETTYGHLSTILVEKGQKVKILDSIGMVGNTGLSKGYHIHYEIRKNGILTNPVDYLLLLYRAVNL